MPVRILLVEDEARIASFITRGLKEAHYVVDVASDGEQGLFMAEVNGFSLIILDVMLPKLDGVSLCRKLREKKINTPILMLSALGSTDDKVKGLNCGADDYLSKPFAFKELLARVQTLLRRKSPDKKETLSVGGLELNQLTYKVSRDGKEILLTGKEYALLEYMMLNAGKLITRTMISENVWHADFDTFTNVIDVYINHLRKKVDSGFDKQLIHTMRGSGYVIKA
jgi:DNA-binding response OmpR family regulator